MRRTWLAEVLFVALAGCTPSVTPEPQPETASLPRPSTSDSGRTTRTAFSYKPGRHVYDQMASASISMRGDTVAAPEVVTSSSRMSLRLEPRNQYLEAFVAVDSFRVSAGSRIGATEQPMSLPSALEARIDADGRITVQDSSPAGQCTVAGGSASTAARELVRSFPRTLELHQQWRDTVQTISCRAGVHLRTTTRSDYVVTRIDDSAVSRTVRVARQGTIDLVGEGQQAGQNVTLVGTGRITGWLTLDVASGILNEGDAEFEIELTLAAGERSQQFLQRGTQRITRRPASP